MKLPTHHAHNLFKTVCYAFDEITEIKNFQSVQTRTLIYSFMGTIQHASQGTGINSQTMTREGQTLGISQVIRTSQKLSIMNGNQTRQTFILDQFEMNAAGLKEKDTAPAEFIAVYKVTALDNMQRYNEGSIQLYGLVKYDSF